MFYENYLGPEWVTLVMLTSLPSLTSRTQKISGWTMWGSGKRNYPFCRRLDKSGTPRKHLTNIREGQDAQRRWFYSSQKFRIFFKHIPDIRMRFLLGMESGGDVKFFSPGGPVWPQRWELMRKWEMRSDGGTRAEKFYITAWLHTQKEPYPAIRNIF